MKKFVFSGSEEQAGLYPGIGYVQPGAVIEALSEEHAEAMEASGLFQGGEGARADLLRLNKAELEGRATEAGLTVPDGATKAQLADLILGETTEGGQ